MASMNPFDLLGDNDHDDPSLLLESASAQLQKAAAAAAAAAALKSSESQLHKPPNKSSAAPPPPSSHVGAREPRNETGRGRGRDFGRGGRGRGGQSRDYPSSNENSFNNSGAPGPLRDEGEGGKTSERRSYGGPRPYRGGRRGGFSNEEGRDGERPRRTYERHSGTGHGNDFKREGAGRGNWGSQLDEIAPAVEEAVEETEKNVNAEDVPAGQEAVDENKEAQPAETEEKEPEEKEMTLEEYEKVLEEKRKALLALKTEERKVEVDKDLQSMQQLSNRKDEDAVFIKLGSDKDKKKEASEKERVKKSVSINEFLKPADGERYYSPGGRGRGRGRGQRGGGGYSGAPRMNNASAPPIEDQKQFPTLGGAPRA
ncbi:hypothetical protein vseg_018912 [Gypsophila vaccaria]